MNNHNEDDNGHGDAFTASREVFAGVLGWLDGDGAATLTHAQLEDQLAVRGRELLRQLYQDHLDVRAVRELRCGQVRDADEVARPAVEASRRSLSTIFGQVDVVRLAYRRRGHANLHPADAALNLPAEKHSHGLRMLAAVEACRGSFEDTVAAIARATGQRVGKRQVEQLAGCAAADFDDFYTNRQALPAADGHVVVLSADGKGIVMRHDGLRAATAKAASESTSKLTSRLSKGDKANRKRMATVGAVYTATPAVRTPADIITPEDHERAPGPTTADKWLTASVVESAATVIADIFDEATRRDPAHDRDWVALVDGNRHQIERIRHEATKRDVTVAIVIDFVHVAEYVWSAAWSFHHEGAPAAETWVADKLIRILAGDARQVAAGIRRRATRNGLDPPTQRNADKAANYLATKADQGLLDYPAALATGWPIATGVIEGACRHLVKDRMDITGARWSLDGAEAVLKLRALHANRDLDAYWTYHLDREHHRTHRTRYANSTIPTPA